MHLSIFFAPGYSLPVLFTTDIIENFLLKFKFWNILVSDF